MGDQPHITRSFSVPVKSRASNLRVTDSRGLIRVISARQTVRRKSSDGGLVPEIGNSTQYIWNLLSFLINVSFFKLLDQHYAKFEMFCHFDKQQVFDIELSPKP